MNKREVKKIIKRNLIKMPLIYSAELDYKESIESDGKITKSQKFVSNRFTISSFYKQISRF
ncbi:hypothetical protein [Flavobacterium macrobrachii]|jgi:hypothetical protein|uniref:hypothetical protein n=1 Tax=Flavobacterium macrobrachii TaxID=591204 RepID=UPI0037BECA3E